MLDSIRLFLRVVQSGNLTAGGRNLNLSPASVSRRIAALENDIGVQLFNRTSRKIVLTEAGEVYYQRVKSLMEGFNEIHESVRAVQNSASGLLRVHSRTAVGIRLIAPRIKEFCAAHPGVTVELHLSEISTNLMEGDFDIDIRLGELEDSSMLARKLAPSDRILVASPGYLAAHPAIVRPEDLLEHNCLTYRPSAEAVRWRFARAGEADRDLKVKGSFSSNNAEVLRRVALSGGGIALLTDWGIQDDLCEARLQQVLPAYRTTNYSFNNGIYAVFRQTRHMPKKIRVFVDFMANQLDARAAPQTRS